jgi:uncharacterized protein (TIGR02611 family)
MAKDPTESTTKPGLVDRGRMTLQVIRANPTGAIALKILVAVLGGLVVAVGLVLIPLPGPGWAIVILGLIIWAVEFVWARHLLHFTRNKLRAWTSWIGRQSWPVRLLVGAAGLVFVGLVLMTTLRFSFGVTVADIWQYITTH